jgi:hypothetical protein
MPEYHNIFMSLKTFDKLEITPLALKDLCQKSPIQFKSDYTTSCGVTYLADWDIFEC